LQPSIAATLDDALRSRYAQLSGSEPGIDPYTRSVSDVYQDLYNEGSFIGKGIYDVDAFEYALKGRFPENRILSHDLLEGCYARSGLVSDIRLYEEQPARYEADVNRQRRWIRGDWQIARWLLPRVPGMEGSQPNPLSGLSQWKILDNLRRSLVPAALVAVLLFAWFATGQALVWTLAIAGSFVLQPVLAAVLCLVNSRADIGMRQTLRKMRRGLGESLALNAFRFACLPYEAWYSLDAIARVIWRLLVSRRGLLEWAPQALEAHKPVGGLSGSYRRMWIAPTLALATALLLAYLDSGALVPALPVLCLWLAAPTLAWAISQPLPPAVDGVNAAQRLFLRRSARKTWAFFERFHAAADNWLPPDNYQEAPGPILAHRTSPTNIGLALLANLSAHDFGYLSRGALLSRIDATFGTLGELERYQGHFYNWYDTLSLQPLPPRYVSAVDSGNLAAHLLVLREGVLALPDATLADQRIFRGLVDTLAVPRHTLATMASAPTDALHALEQLQAQLARFVDEAPTDLHAVLQALGLLMATAHETANALQIKALAPTHEDTGEWLATFARQCREHIDDLLFLAPWLALAPPPAAIAQALPRLVEPGASILTLRELAEDLFDPELAADAAIPAELSAGQSAWLHDWREARRLGAERAALRIASCEQLARQADGFADMDYEFLYDRTRHLLAIGYNADEFRRDASFYDLLASEARLCSFVAIAQGKLPQESWFALGRLLTNASGDPVLVSWSGSMFEYLMPLLVMPSYESTLLDRTCRAAVAHQIAYGRQRGVPWGISESGYNLTDAHLNYQYHAFGVPGLGLQRGLGNNLVISPYASALALLVAPEAAAHNLQQLSTSGFEGPYGFYEAIDYTPARLGRAQSHVVVRSYMAHHQGMTLLALAHQLCDAPMQRRFSAVPLFQATLLLLQERIPATSLFYNPPPEDRVENVVPIAGEPPVNVPFGAVTPVPEVQLLSNGRYHVMLTNAGGGYSRWKDAAITRWREDTTRDHWGSFIYVRDADSGEFWSTTYQPTLKKATSYEALFNTGRAEYRRQDHDIETYTEIVISPEDDVELRRVRLTNRSSTVRTLDVTSYAEVVLNAPAADALQPAFSNLFVQTRILRERQAILCTRRPRSAVEHTPSLFHLLRADGIDTAFISYETDRMRFIGRGQTLEAPAAIQEAADLSGSEGSVLDPIVAIRCRVTLEPHKSVTLDFVYGIGADSDVCSGLIDKYHDRHLTERAFDMAYPHAAVTLRQINASESDAQLYRRLAGHMLYARQTLRADPSVLLQNRRGQSGLWGYSISGDLPILLLKISSVSHVDIAQQLIQCHAYWRLKGLMTDLVIWNEDHVGYRQVLLDRIMALIATGPDAHAIDRPGGIFVRSGEQISSEDRILLQTVARAIISDDQGTLAEQLKRREAPERRVARLTTIRPHRAELPVTTMPEATGLVLTNGLGGFTEDGREYIITTVPGQMTPLPWVNVLANPDFGSIVAETGLGYTWSENAHEFRLTPWSNDAVGATGGEAFYLRDEESGHFWSPTPLPARGNQVYRTRHGFGYSVFEYRSGGGLVSELSVYVDLEMPVKFFVLKVRNESGRPRKLSATGYVEWVLGDLRTKSAMHIVTEIDAASGALFARNAYHSEFGSRVGFFDVDDASRTLTGDRSEFFGRNGDLACPDAMTRARLSGRLGAGFDPCGAIQVPFELAVGQERQIIFRLGAGRSREHARELARRLRTPGSARAALEKVHHYWRHTLDAVRIETPDPALNVLTNGWLVYQTLACRFWARSGFYQSGGAYGFRDQLQDAMALVHARPEVLRQQLLRSAAHQYLEGDVQHWWHPPADRGVRTRCSDDYLWLPLAASRYVMVTGDAALLSEPVPFITGRALTAEEESYYDLPVPANESASLYRHCVLAIEHGLRFGERGLPLMGSGDWNDGMNLVGIHGKGESVWLGFFLYRVLKDFAAIARMREDVEFAERCQTEAETLRENLSAHAWDGQWYKRAWFDDGTPLGSSTNDECAIDSIAQSWSVLSGAGEPERSRIALESLDKHLVRRDAKLIQLLDPPFDKSRLDPGYIKGYVPGVRENGGQYTHAAIWAAMAFAVSGNSERAWELLSMINPVNHGTDPATRDVYKVEPYVVAADVYGVAPHTGRGGWSWYTGSAGWMYRLIIEALLGLQREGKRLLLNPSMPAAWPSCVLHYRFGESVYHIRVRRMASTAPQVTLDGSTQNDKAIELVDDGREHEVEVTIP
jgi:cellobiose phosphorylase